MKTRYWLLPLLFLFVLLPACQKDSDLTLPQPADQSKIEKRQTGRANWTPIGPCEAHQLVVFIPANCIGTDWEQGIQDAVAAYNVTPTSLHFEVTFTHPEIADIIFD